MHTAFTIVPIGTIRNQNDRAWLEIAAPYREAMHGLEDFSHIHVLYWFHENDTPDKRRVLQVHPCRNEDNPLTGIFATHSPLRPNLIANSLCKILSIREMKIHIDRIDARDGSPLIDIKCFIPSQRSFTDLRLPDWVPGKERH
jgi:tRNA-Thr(GGU) m(6)t(6)A37 methyltransferase TsaA